MEKLIEAVGLAVERILNTVNSAKKLLVVIVLSLLITCFYLVYQLAQSQDLITSIIEPRIEYISGLCYLQQIRGGINGLKGVTIQFPVAQDLIELGVEQNVSALLIRKKTTPAQFKVLCDRLIAEILDPEVESQILKNNPEWKERLQEYYRELDKPKVKVPGLPSVQPLTVDDIPKTPLPKK